MADAFFTNSPSTIITLDIDNNTEFSIPFEFLARKFVVVTLLGVDRKVLTLNSDYRFIAANKIRLEQPAPAGYQRIEIRRFTSTTDRLVSFVDGSILRANDLNLAQVQTIHVAEEARDLTSYTIGVNDSGDLDARNRKIVNVANGTDSFDAVNLGQLRQFDTSTGINAEKAALSAAKAKESELNAANSEARCVVAEAKAIASAGTAMTAASDANRSKVEAKQAEEHSVQILEDVLSASGPSTELVAKVNKAESDAATALTTATETKEALNNLSASSIPTSSGSSVQQTIDNVYIVTGSVNIANPYWGAPSTDTADPAAAEANRAAIQKMLNSGAKMCSLDSKPRYLVDTLIMDTRGQTFCGQGKDDEGLIFYGGDVPIISRANPSNLNGMGKSGMRVEHMRIADRSPNRVNAWSIDLTNGDSNGVDSIFLDGLAGLGATANYGVALGLAYGSTLQPNVAPTFVCHIRNSRLSLAKAILNTSDSYVEDNEIWANFRNFTIQIGAGGNLVQGNQFVPGSQAGLLFKSQNNFLINIMRVIGNYFDGSYDSIITGAGIACDQNSGIMTSTFSDNTFWHINGIGASFTVFNESEFRGIFEDCASADAAGTPDLYIEAMSGSRIDCTHKRSAIAPKTNAQRVNMSPPVQAVATIGGAVNHIKQNVTSASTYAGTQIGNPAYVVDEGKILNRAVDQIPVNGTIQVKGGVAYFCVNNIWKPITA